jgi:cardiolipin synthase
MRIILALVIVSFSENIPLVIVLLFIAGISDVLDGRIARKYKMSSVIGGFVDGISDKLMMLILGWFFIMGMGLHWIYLGLFIIREIMQVIMILLGYLFSPDSLDSAGKSHVGGKVTTVLQYLALLFIIFRIGYVEVLIILIGITGVVSNWPYAKAFLKW